MLSSPGLRWRSRRDRALRRQHLIAFGSGDADADHARLAQRGFNPVPVVRLQRNIEVPGGEDTAFFGVVRVPPGTNGRMMTTHRIRGVVMTQLLPVGAQR